MTVVEFLEKFAADYTLEEGRPVVRAREVVMHRGLGGAEVARPAVIRADGKRYMCVVPLFHTIDLAVIRERLGAFSVEYIDDAEMRNMFPCCEQGAESPFGALYGLPTLMDASLEQDEYIAFQGETYDKAILMTVAEYKRLASPRVFVFARPAEMAMEVLL